MERKKRIEKMKKNEQKDETRIERLELSLKKKEISQSNRKKNEITMKKKRVEDLLTWNSKREKSWLE